MIDPAIEAAQRVIESHQGGVLAMADIAREALRPIRTLHKSRIDQLGRLICAEDWHRWPCTTAKLIYSTEELES